MSDNDFDWSNFFQPFDFSEPLWPSVDCKIYGVAGKKSNEVVAVCTFAKNVKREDRIKEMTTNRCYQEMFKVCDENGWKLVSIVFM